MNRPEPLRSIAQLGSKIRQRRKERGYTQADICDYAGCSLRYLSDLEHGKETAEIGKALRVINTLGMDLSTIDR